MHPPKLYKFDEVIKIIFVSGKKSAITFGEGCTLMLDIHVYSALMAWDLGYLAKKVQDIPPTLTKINLFGLTWFLCIRYICIQKYVDHFFILEIQFFAGKKITNLEPHPPVAMLWIANYINLWLWLIDRWNIIFYLPSAVILLNHGHTDLSIASMIGLQLCTAWIVSSCFNIHAYSILSYKENATWILFT